MTVFTSARLPSKDWTSSGKPSLPVSSPTVIWGSRRLSLESPGFRYSSSLWVSK